MLTEKITYTDHNDNQRTELFYFNLSKAEVIEWEMRVMDQGGLVKLLEEVEEAKDGRKIMDFFRDLIEKSYGVKSEDGRTFQKSKEISQAFMGSEAYSELFMSLIYNPEKAAAFSAEILPKDLAAAVAKIPTNVENIKSSIPAHVAQPQDYRRNRVQTPTRGPISPEQEAEIMTANLESHFDGEVVGEPKPEKSLTEMSTEELEELLRRRREG